LDQDGGDVPGDGIDVGGVDGRDVGGVVAVQVERTDPVEPVACPS
jgi:hypothetical protein